MTDILGQWKISEMNAMDMSFKQTWMTIEELDSSESVPEMQKMMAKAAYRFEPDGRFLQLMPKEAGPLEGCEEYDERYFVGHVGGWKQEDGKYLVEYDDGWSEAVPCGDGFELFGFFRIVRDE
ncbi:MAG: hypothetical protein IKR86_06870 [Candidatus Methanomethylophilaceae archaeon]|nr:hypothetical protein [Candidatus Methanomethylophilaceae archaeon]